MTPRYKIPAILGGKPAFNAAVPITEPTIPPIKVLKKKYEQVLRSGMITNSKNVQEFESRIAEYLGVRNAVAMASCTSGLMLIMKALGLKGEVILPSFTFHATAHAAAWNNLRPVLVDCDRKTYNIDPEEVERAITPKTSAILAVHVFGNPPDIDALEKIADKYKVELIFDAAHGFGAKYKGRKAGGFGHAESFSLSPTKLVTAGEGGIVTTNDEELAEKIRIGRNYGDPGTYDCEFSGLSARMNEFSAILGIESLRMLDKNVARRNKAASLYHELLSDMPGISFQKICKSDQSSYKDFSIMIDGDRFGMDRDRLSGSLMAENIITKKYFYPPLHLQKIFLSFNKNNTILKNTERISSNSLSLPLYSHISAGDIIKICDAIRRIYHYREKVLGNISGRQ